MDATDADTSLNEINMNDGDLQDHSMMDTTMDDLFGDAGDAMNVNVNLSLPTPTALPPPGLIQRIADLQASGACSKLAWSNTGSIARISPDGLKVTFCVFVEDSKTGAWVPGKESPHPVHAPEGSHFVHVQFGPLGNDLAVVDDVGLVHLFIAPTGLGRTFVSQTEFGHDRTGRSSNDAIAGLHWLPIWPIEWRTPYFGPATKNKGTWTIPLKGRDPNLPRVHNPCDGKNAVLYVTRNNRLTLMYQQESGRWHVLQQDLTHTGLSEEQISHASFCEYGNCVLLAVYDEARRFRVLTVSIHWNAAHQPRPNGQQSVRVNPALSVAHLAGIEHVTAQHSDSAQLTCLTVMPSVPDHVADFYTPSPPTIIATFNHAVLPVDRTQQISEQFTTFSRWQLIDVAQTMHESFGKLSLNASTAPAASPSTTLRRLPDQITMRLVLSTRALSFGTLLAFTTSDMTVEFRDRSTLDIVEPSMEINTVSSLPQAGFGYEAGLLNTDAVVSNDGAALAYILPDGKLDGKTMLFKHGWQHLEDDGLINGKSLVEAAVMCIARQHTVLASNSAATAETLSLLPPDLSPDMYQLFFNQLGRMMARTYDVLSLDENKKQMALLKDPHLPRALSAQLVLGTRSRGQPPTLPAQLAWAILNIKHVGLSLITTTGRGETVPGVGADVIHSLQGLVRWSIDVFVDMLEALLTVARKVAKGVPVLEAIQTFLTETKNPAFHLLLCSYPRTFLRYTANYLSRYFKIQAQKISTARSLLEKQQMMELARLGETLPFKIDTVISLIVETERAISDAYTKTNTPDRARAEIELSMITECSIPEQLHDVLTNLIKTTLPKVLPDLDRGKLYFWDTAWLSLQPKSDEAPRYDALKKTLLKEGAKLRRCRRCNSAMEDVAATVEANHGLPPWLLSSQRQCVCTCAWYLP